MHPSFSYNTFRTFDCGTVIQTSQSEADGEEKMKILMLWDLIHNGSDIEKIFLIGTTLAGTGSAFVSEIDNLCLIAFGGPSL